MTTTPMTASPGRRFIGLPSGTNYTADNSGNIAVLQQDVLAMLNNGCQIQASATPPPRYAITYSASPALDGTINGTAFDLTLTGNIAPTLINTSDNFAYTLYLQQDATGGRTATWPASWKWVGATPLVLSTAGGSIDTVDLLVRGTSIIAVSGKGIA
jgi:hypothetical protein